MDTQRILIDTSIAVDGGEAIIAKLEKIAPVFVTDIVLQELDGHKNNANGEVAFQAREFFRRLGSDNGKELHVMPLSSMPLEKGDTLRKMTLGNTPLHVIVRKSYKTKNINDSKIIEIAKDYNMTLVTLDMAQRVRAVSEGVDVATLNAIITPTKEDNKHEEKVMSEIEKEIGTESIRQSNTIKTLIVVTVLTLIFGSIILSYIATETVFWTFIIGCFAVASTLINMKFGKTKNSDFLNKAWQDDVAYSGQVGNKYHVNFDNN